MCLASCACYQPFAKSFQSLVKLIVSDFPCEFCVFGDQQIPIPWGLHAEKDRWRSWPAWTHDRGYWVAWSRVETQSGSSKGAYKDEYCTRCILYHAVYYGTCFLPTQWRDEFLCNLISVEPERKLPVCVCFFTCGSPNHYSFASAAHLEDCSNPKCRRFEQPTWSHFPWCQFYWLRG